MLIDIPCSVELEFCRFFTTLTDWNEANNRMKQIKFVDTTVRDGSLSLWALGMRTGAMLAIAEQMDQCGFESMEFFGFAGYIKYVKEHKENPWVWMGEGRQKVSPHAAALPRWTGVGI